MYFVRYAMCAVAFILFRITDSTVDNDVVMSFIFPFEKEPKPNYEVTDAHKMQYYYYLYLLPFFYVVYYIQAVYAMAPSAFSILFIICSLCLFATSNALL